MTTEQRIRTYLFLEKIGEQQEYSERLGLENRSRFHGKAIEEREEKQ